MGPGAGTAALGGCGLGFANVVRPGRVGIVAAAGTGAQEAMSLLDRWGEGVTQVIGVGGRDLSADVGGRMAALAVRALAHDPATEIDPPRLQATVAGGRARRRPGGRRHADRGRPRRPRPRRGRGRGDRRHPDAGGRRPRHAHRLGSRPAGPGRRRGATTSSRRWSGSTPSGRSSGACTPGARSATRRSPCSSPGWARSGPTRRSTSAIACRRRPAATPASTWARRSTPGAGPTR